jgi:predicted MPP superfamily phosphohydrolase
MEVTLSHQVIDRYVESLPSEPQRIAFLATVNHLRDLSQNARVLGEFLSSFATSVADLYAATSVAIWFEDTANNVQRKVDVGWRNLSLDESTSAAHRELVLYAIHLGKAIAVRDAFKTYTAARPADFMMMLGDNAYNDGTDPEYQEAVFETYPELLRQLPLWSTLGNHDGHSADSNGETGPYYEIFDLPRAAEVGGYPSGT